jgi:hypothetical protein
MPFVIGPPRSPVIKELIRLQEEERKKERAAVRAAKKAESKKANPNVDRGLNRQARNPVEPASNGPKVENGLGTPQGVGPFQEGAPRSRGRDRRKVGMPDQHLRATKKSNAKPPAKSAAKGKAKR